LSFLHKHARAVKLVLALLALVHFFYFLVAPKVQTDTSLWEKQTCNFKESLEIVDLDCRYYKTKNWIFAQPALDYAQPLQCHQLKTERGKELYERKQENDCGAPVYWGTPQKISDIGWDAYSIWWGRAAVLFQRSKADDWPGLTYALLDRRLITTFSNSEHHHYPWLISVVYFSVMKIVDSANPYILQVLHFLLWVFTVFLFWSTWRSAPRYLLLMFAFVPTAAIFMTRLYADSWMVFWALLIIFAFQRKKLWLVVGASVAMALTKQEAVMQGSLLLFALYSSLAGSRPQKGEMLSLTISLFAFLFSFFFYSTFKSDYYIPLSDRLADPASIGLFFRRIVPYYLDVLFRPALWGLLWPWVFFLLYKSRKQLGLLIWLPVLVLLAIPFAYFSFPYGHKEVVLTGSGRALWQLMPLVWLLLERASQKNKEAFLVDP